MTTNSKKKVPDLRRSKSGTFLKDNYINAKN